MYVSITISVHYLLLGSFYGSLFEHGTPWGEWIN